MLVQVQSLLNTKNVERFRKNDIQSQSLAAAGIERAIRRTQISPDYLGETWEIPANQIVGSGAGRVTISVIRSNTENTIEVVSAYPVESNAQVQVRRTKTIQVRLTP